MAIRYQLKRTRRKDNGPPEDLLIGELAANIGSRPPILWIGTPDGPVKLNDLDHLGVDELERLAKTSFDVTLIRQLGDDELKRIRRRLSHTGMIIPMNRR